MLVIFSPSRRKANTAVETGSANINRAALLAKDWRVPQVINTCAGKTPNSARMKKRRHLSNLSPPVRVRLSSLLEREGKA
jgi:hypothetical protein